MAVVGVGIGAGLLAAPWVWRAARPLVYKDVIDFHARAAGLDPLLVMAVVRAESRFTPTARSGRGAVGLMQLMPETARDLARRSGEDPDAMDLEDPETNVRLGIAYLALLRREFGEGDALLAAYNAGPAKAREWARGGGLVVDKVPYPETRSFIRRVRRTEYFLRRLKSFKDWVRV